MSETKGCRRTIEIEIDGNVDYCYRSWMRQFILLITILIITSNAGCASVAVRTGAYTDRLPLYPATAADVGLVSYVVARPFIPLFDPTFSPDAQEAIVYVLLPIAVIDFPLAVAVDTVCLPYDIHKLLAKRSEGKSPNKDAPEKPGRHSE